MSLVEGRACVFQVIRALILKLTGHITMDSRGLSHRRALREAKIEEELYRIFASILEKRNSSTEGIRFDRLEPQFHVDSGIADLMLPIHPSKPLLIIECKRKAQTGKGMTIFRDFDPMSGRFSTLLHKPFLQPRACINGLAT